MTATAAAPPAAAPAPAPAAHGTFAPLRVRAVEPLTDDAVLVELEVPEQLRAAYAFAPGQHLTLRAAVGGRELRRSYSICTTPRSGRLAVAVKRLDGGAFSSWVLEHLRAGDVLDVMVPAGRFGAALAIGADPARERHVAAVAAGSGITPVLPLLTALLEEEPGSRCTLVLGNRTAGSVMLLEELADLKDRFPDRCSLVHVLSRERGDVDLLAGRVDRAKLERLLDAVVPPEDVDDWLLCGPFAMVEEARAVLLERGVPPSRVHLELFFVDGEPPPVRAPAARSGGPGARARLVARLGGRDVEADVPEDASALDALLAVRPDAPYACRGGVCGTCRARLVEGEVAMARSYALDPEEVEAGFVLACQSAPVSPRVVLDFDA